MYSIANAPWGPPKPRNAVFDCVFVFPQRPTIDTSGSQYALSKWHTARVITGPDRSAEKPQRDVMSTETPSITPASS